MATVSISTTLPIPAPQARALAATPEIMLFVMAPILSFSMEQALPPGEPIEPGFSARGRVRWLTFIPSWKHEITVVALDDLEVRTRERGGPVKVWNHHLVFEPLDDESCRYTDEIEVEDGLRGLGTRTFIHLMFRHRHRRWRSVAAIVRAAGSTV